MPYRIADIEASAPIDDLALAPHHDGLAVVVRWHGAPVGFWHEPLPGGTTLSGALVAQRVERHVGPRLIAAELHAKRPAEAPARLSLTVAICTHGRPSGVDRLLTSFDSLIEPEAGWPAPFDILVVDNAPPDGETRAVATGRHAAGHAVRYVVEPKIGLNFARNRAVYEAQGQILAFLDDDEIVDRQWLVGLAEAASENPEAGAFTGLVLPLALETEAQILFERRGGFVKGFEKRRFGEHLPGNPSYPCGAGIFGAGANMAFRLDALRRLGGFDEALDTGAALPGGGDTDMFYRVIRGGYPLVYEPRYATHHEHRRDLDGLRRQYGRSWGTGTMALMEKIYQTDTEMRPRVRALIRWWLGPYLLRLLRDGLTRGGPVSPRMVWSEFAGGVAGWFGGYRRSQRRVAAIRETTPRPHEDSSVESAPRLPHPT